MTSVPVIGVDEIDAAIDRRGAVDAITSALRDGVDIEADAPRLYAKIVALADGGDLDALKFLVSRAWPARRGRPVTLSIPVSEDGGRSPLALLSAVLDAVARGDMTAEEAESLSRTVEAHGKAIDSTALARIEALAGEPKPRPRLAA